VSALLGELGEPILSSTLIMAGESAPLNDPEVIRKRLETRIDGVIDAGPCSAEPTTIVDLAVLPAVIVRQGRGDAARLGLTGV